MDEDTLRTAVLIPLFRAMKYQDVFHYHGGPQEQGKDIVMWKAEDFRPRVNYGVVAKATKITGQATGRSSAAEVYFQIMQCLGEAFQDPRTTERRSVDHCLVVCNKDISKESTIALGNALAGTKNDRLVTFINGDELWGLVEQHMPNHSVIERLASAREDLENASEHHRILASTSAEGITLQVQPKHPDAARAESLEVSGRIELPDTEEGRAVLERFRQHLNSGTPVEIDGCFVKEFRVPEFLQDLVDPEGEGIGKLVLGPRQLRKPIAARIEFSADDGSVVSLDGIEFQGIQVGSDELTLSNYHQALPWHFELKLARATKLINLRFDLADTGSTAKRELEAARLTRMWSLGADLMIYSQETGLPIVGARIPPGSYPAPDPKYIVFLEKLMAIQEKLRYAFLIPEREITPEEVKFVYDLAYKLSAGTAIGTSKEMTITLHAEGAVSAVERFAGGRTPPLTWVTHEKGELLGVPIDLGPVVITVQGLSMSHDDWEQLRAAVGGEISNDGYGVRLVALDNPAQVTFRYVNFLSTDERAALEASFPALAAVAQQPPNLLNVV